MGTDRSLVGAKKPALQERGNPMDAREVLVGMTRGAGHRCTKVPIGEPERFEELHIQHKREREVLTSRAYRARRAARREAEREAG